MCFKQSEAVDELVQFWNSIQTDTFVVFLLQYNTKYYYRIGTGATAREFWFQTPPEIDPDAPYIFGIIGGYPFI